MESSSVVNSLSSLETQTLKIGQMEFPARKVWVKTYGCQMNHHDTERMLHQLQELNFTPVENQEEANLLIFNTCAVRDLANQKFYSQVGEVKLLKKTSDPKQPRDVKIAVSGCVAQTEGKEILSRYPHVDFAFGTDVIDNLKEMLFRSYSGEDRFNVNTWDKTSDYSIETKVTHGSPVAFVNIIKGCDKFCSYCIVPFTRGRERSRRLVEVVKDVARLVEHSGVQEVMLLGQNVNSFGKDRGETFAQLLSALNEISGLKLIRYTTSHPYDMTDELIQAHGQLEKLAPHVHLPVQSGSNTVLKRMLRQYSVEHYLSLLEKLRKAKPGIVISSDIIAGFPNETLQEHEETLRFLKQAQFDFIYSYAFSKRRGTKAWRMGDILDDDIRGERLREIQQLQLDLQKEQRQQLVGKEVLVLIDSQSQLHGVQKWKGRTPCYRIVHLEPTAAAQEGLSAPGLLWHWVLVKITSATALACKGELVQDFGTQGPLSH